jgi:Delta7-sterol 5-desaturase
VTPPWRRPLPGQRAALRKPHMPDLLRTASTATVGVLVFGYFLGLTLLGVAVGFAVERAFPTKRIFAVPLAKGQYRFESIGNVVFVAVTTFTFTLALRADLVRIGPSSLARDAATFFALVFSFQAFYWMLHRAMHTRVLLFVHRWHHRSRVTTPLSGQSVSFGEALGWMLGYVGVPMLLSRVVPIGFTGWMAYMAFNVLGNIVGHANVELTAKSTATRTAALFANPFVYHALHHARWTVNFSFQAAMMDRIFGTEAADWPELYERVSNGHALRSLHERGKSRAAAEN